MVKKVSHVLRGVCEGGSVRGGEIKWSGDPVDVVEEEEVFEVRGEAKGGCVSFGGGRRWQQVWGLVGRS